MQPVSTSARDEIGGNSALAVAEKLSALNLEIFPAAEPVPTIRACRQRPLSSGTCPRRDAGESVYKTAD